MITNRNVYVRLGNSRTAAVSNISIRSKRCDSVVCVTSPKLKSWILPRPAMVCRDSFVVEVRWNYSIQGIRRSICIWPMWRSPLRSPEIFWSVVIKNLHRQTFHQSGTCRVVLMSGWNVLCIQQVVRVIEIEWACGESLQYNIKTIKSKSKSKLAYLHLRWANHFDILHSASQSYSHLMRITCIWLLNINHSYGRIISARFEFKFGHGRICHNGNGVLHSVCCLVIMAEWSYQFILMDRSLECGSQREQGPVSI